MNALDILLQQTKLPQSYGSFLKTYHSLQASIRMFQMLNELNSQNRTPVSISIDVSDSPVAHSPNDAGDPVAHLPASTTHHSSILKKRVNKVKGEIPASLAESFSYQGNERWVEIFWAPEPINKPICSDGRTVYCGTPLAWELFLESIIHSFDVLNDSLNTVSFLFDRWEHNLYYGSKETITELLSNPECLALLQPSSTPATFRNQVTQIRDFAAVFILGGILGATLAGVLFSIGLGLFQATHGTT